MLTAVVRRLRQLDKDASEAERTRVLAFRRIGELLGPAKQSGNNVSGVNQYTVSAKFEPSNFALNPKTLSENPSCPKGDPGAGEMEHADIVVNVLLPADQQPPEAVQP